METRYRSKTESPFTEYLKRVKSGQLKIRKNDFSRARPLDEMQEFVKFGELKPAVDGSIGPIRRVPGVWHSISKYDNKTSCLNYMIDYIKEVRRSIGFPDNRPCIECLKVHLGLRENDLVELDRLGGIVVERD